MLINWPEVFEVVCGRANGALDWGLPEPWIHAELYSELKKQELSYGWTPLPTEVPYVTFYPVALPKKTNRSWESAGAVKWVDLCLHREKENEWCWFEFKVRHAGEQNRRQQAETEARDAFRKDIVALSGFDSETTAESWKNPDKFTNAFWFDELLKPRASAIRSGEHYFVAAYLQIGSQLDSMLWAEEVFRRQIESWFFIRNKRSASERNLPDINICNHGLIEGGHSLQFCEWSLIP